MPSSHVIAWRTIESSSPRFNTVFVKTGALNNLSTRRTRVVAHHYYLNGIVTYINNVRS